MLALVFEGACDTTLRIGIPDAAVLDAAVLDAPPTTIDAGVAQTWIDHLNGLISDSAHSVYAYHFTGAPPDGAHYYFALYSQAGPEACSHYSGGGMLAGAGGDFWLLEVELGGGVGGSYAVVFPNYVDHGSSSATIRLSHRVNGGWLESYSAVGGTISVTSGPSLADTKAGARLAGLIEADFETDPVQLVGCEGGASVSTGTMESVCRCVRTDGTSFSCPVALDKLESSCCHSQGAQTFRVSTRFGAEYCSGMCAVIAGLPAYCSDVL